VSEATGYSSRLLIERMIEPLREINCSVLGSVDDHATSVCEEPVHSDEILSYADKYMPGNGSKGSTKISETGAKGAVSGGNAKTVSGGMSSTRRRIPADLPESVASEIRRLASETFRVLGCDGVARVDFILEERKDTPTIYINEINAIPGSLSFYLWEATGVSFAELMDRLVAGALKRDRAASHKTVSYHANIFSMGLSAGSGGKTPGAGSKTARRMPAGTGKGKA
jgi:D-alanine-D-alanine ligase